MKGGRKVDLKLSYEELERRLEQIEAECGRLAGVEAELKRSLQFTKSLLSAIPTPIFYKDVQGRYLGCNPAFTEIMGVSTEALRGKTVDELWPSEHAEVYHRKDLELMQRRGQQVYEFEIKDKHGAIRPVIYYKNTFLDEYGHVAGLVGGFVDITERKRAERELQTIFSMSLDMLCIADIHTATFLKINPAFVQTLGFSEEELLGRSFLDFIHPEDMAATRSVIEESLKRGLKVINFKIKR